MIAHFGRFRLDTHRRELLADGVRVPIGSRAFDVLVVLVEGHGKLVPKDTFFSRVWHGTIVEENTFQFQISTLRKALGPDRDFIKTIAGRGYRFIADVTLHDDPEAVPPDPITLPGDSQAPTNLPISTSDIIGREARIADILNLVAAHRLVTLAGAGGIGKTRLGLEVGRRLLPKFADGVWIAELGPLSDPELVLPTVAVVLGLASGAASPEHLVAALASKHLLLVLDNCEHVIDAAARLAEALLRASLSLSVIATSQEPLRVDGEHVYRVPPLDVPADRAGDIADALEHSAVRLFIERARAAGANFPLDARTVVAAASICRRLDGIPLAIELAAASAAALGVDSVASRLDNRFNLLSGGRRMALPRHQTLRATLDWSYDLLSEPERIIMRRLGIFAGGFTLQAAGAVVGRSGDAAGETINQVLGLVAKSLVAADGRGAEPRYRLLETMRAYALEKLGESGEIETIARRHAEYFRDVLEQADPGPKIRPRTEWLAAFGRSIDDARAALDWAFSPSGDTTIGVALTIASERLWVGLSLMDEYRRWVECALASLTRGVKRDARQEMRLYAALGAALYYTIGAGPEATAAWTDVLAIAERLDDTEYRSRALWGLWADRMRQGECLDALIYAHGFSNLPPNPTDPTDLISGERMVAVSLHYFGDQINARRHLDNMLARHSASTQGSHGAIIRFRFDLRVTAHTDLVRILWLQGFLDQAVRVAEEAIEDARAVNHVVSLCSALDASCLVARAVGDLATAERSVATLLELSAKHALGYLHAWGHGSGGQLLIDRGDPSAGLRSLRTALEELREAKFVLRRPAILGALANGLAAIGQGAQALATIDEALTQSERTDERWNMAELLRIKGELRLLDGNNDAEDYFQRAVGVAHHQGALYWELRSAISLARSWRMHGRIADARLCLASVYARFTEGFACPDLKAARALLDTLQ